MRAVNLIPAEQRKGGAIGRRSQGVAFAVLGLLAGAALLTFLYGSASHQLESRKAEAAALTEQAQQVQAQAAQLSSYTSFIQMREQRLQAISQLIGSRFDWSATMYELSRVLPAHHLAQLAAGHDRLRDWRAPPKAPPLPPLAPPLHGVHLPPPPRPPPSPPPHRPARPHLHARRVRDQPDRGCADARAPAFDQRRQQCHPAELRQIRQQRWRRLRRLRWHVPGRRPLLHRAGELPAAADSAELERRNAGGERLERIPRRRLVEQERPQSGVHQLQGSGRMTTRDRMVLIAVVVLVLLAGGWVLVVSPERKQGGGRAGAGAERAPAARNRQEPGQQRARRRAALQRRLQLGREPRQSGAALR